MPRHEAIRPIAAKTSGKYIIFIRSVSETVSLFAIFERNKLTARIIAAAKQMQRNGYAYPKEWETAYLE